MLETVDDLVAKWEKTSLLKGLSDDNKRIMAAALDNQRRFNEQRRDGEYVDAWKRNSIPLVRRVIAGLLEDGIDVTAEISYLYGQYHILDSSLEWDMYSEEKRPQWERCCIKLDWECEYTLNFVEETKAVIKQYMREGNYDTFRFKAIGWFNHGRPFGQVAFYGDFMKGMK